jgi:hypothetical protein
MRKSAFAGALVASAVLVAPARRCVGRIGCPSGAGVGQREYQEVRR